MFYTKNVPAWERLVRIAAGVAGLVFATMSWGVSGIAVTAGLTGAVLALTGLAGFCPMCALAGRKLKAGR
ncbi:MAG: DUF2892 domain-containing protein [Uliginosibacterium sp.]|nr:DUF2892 domain-containing protein [Uliginosibacterium sp.]MBK9617470.1 DUF2892 domain-containing protein [Uliginosibacterium sp.]